MWCILGAESRRAGRFDNRENVVELPAGAKSVDLTEYVRSELLVTVPFKPLCKETCKGLCPRCGTDLNAGSCECKPEQAESRWEALRHLKKNM
jgi:uncharacterized protein